MIMSSDQKNYNTGVAAEYYVLSLLYRLGYEAYLTVGNKKSIDIRVVMGDRTITIDVKAVQGYSSLIVNNVRPQRYHFCVFCCYNNKFDDPTQSPSVYIVPSLDLPKIMRTFGTQTRVFKRDLLSYQDRWAILE